MRSMNACARSILNRDVRLDRRVAISVLGSFLDRGRCDPHPPFRRQGRRIFRELRIRAAVCAFVATAAFRLRRIDARQSPWTAAACRARAGSRRAFVRQRQNSTAVGDRGDESVEFQEIVAIEGRASRSRKARVCHAPPTAPAQMLSRVSFPNGSER